MVVTSVVPSEALAACAVVGSGRLAIRRQALISLCFASYFVYT